MYAFNFPWFQHPSAKWSSIAIKSNLMFIWFLNVYLKKLLVEYHLLFSISFKSSWLKEFSKFSKHMFVKMYRAKPNILYIVETYFPLLNPRSLHVPLAQKVKRIFKAYWSRMAPGLIIFLLGNPRGGHPVLENLREL